MPENATAEQRGVGAVATASVLAVPPVDGPDAEPGEPQRRRPALSPSRAGDYKTCPLLYRYRAIDRLPEPPSPEAARGSLVHAVLEELFALPAEQRTERTALDAVEPMWKRLSEEYPGWPGLPEPDQEVDPPDDSPAVEPGPTAGAILGDWLESARDRLRTYFALEDPTRFSAEATELLLEIEVGDGVLLRGYLDRLDVSAGGAIRIVDYKTGRAPGELFEQSALFQMKFYALMVLRSRGLLPRQLKLLYLGDGSYLTYAPAEDELAAFERTLGALWQAILRSRRTGEFIPRPGRSCQWCAYKPFCPEFGGTPPPYPFPDADPEQADVREAVPSPG